MVWLSEAIKIQGANLKIGYARVSTKDQSFHLQIDALCAAGCERVYTETVSGARAERPVLGDLLHNIRSVDVLVIWKLDRLGRSFGHLVELVGSLMDTSHTSICSKARCACSGLSRNVARIPAVRCAVRDSFGAAEIRGRSFLLEGVRDCSASTSATVLSSGGAPTAGGNTRRNPVTPR